MTKFRVEVDSEEAIGEVPADAFRVAERPRPGVSFVALPVEIMDATAPDTVRTPVTPVRLGSGFAEAIAEAARLIEAADLVLTIGFDPIEYDQALWNKARQRDIVHIDAVPCDIDSAYKPAVEIVGDIADTLAALAAQLHPRNVPESEPGTVIDEMEAIRRQGAAADGSPIHPLWLVANLQAAAADDVTLCLDMGPFPIWIARYLQGFKPRQLVVTNGQQTLGVAMPRAIAACLCRPDDRAISVPGDGGLLYSTAEMETAVRLKMPLLHIIWRDGFHDMVRFQQEMKYRRSSNVAIGPIDTVRFAEAAGARGFAIQPAEDFAPTLRKLARAARTKTLARQLLPHALN